MTLPESSWVRYTKLLSSINSTAARKYEAYLKTHETGSKAGRKAAIDYAAALVQKYGESAAAVSCEMYDGIAEAAGVLVPAAEPAAVATYGEVAKTVNGMMKQEQSEETIANAIGRLVKRTGADTTLQNAKRDGAEFAWIPHGDTCSFCLMLASNGWRKASKKTIKGDHAEHIHSGCDCEFAIRFDGKPDYAGYDPEKYRAMYDNAEGDTWQEKLNSMRREDYAANKDRINEQKRAAYARRKENLSEHTADGTISKKFVDRLISFLGNPATEYSFEEIEAAMNSSPIGKDAANYISENGYTVSLYYDDNELELAGEIFGKDIYIYPYNNDGADEISATIIHELCHKRYEWNKTMEDEVNCRLMELMHLKGDASEEDIKNIIEIVRKEYSNYPEGNLYGY